MLDYCHKIVSAHVLIISYGSAILNSAPSSLSASIEAELCKLGNGTCDGMYSKDIISNLQSCFKWSWQLQHIRARHRCSLYLHGCLLLHMIKCYELWPYITR